MAAGILAWPAAPAQAHPLGNFSVNQYAGLTLHPDRVDVTAFVDAAEIPTLQDRTRADTDSDGTLSPAERTSHARSECDQLAAAFAVSAAGERLTWTLSGQSYAVTPGAGGLSTSRLACSLSAPIRLTDRTELTVDNGYRTDRVGWREMTATGAGISLAASSLPAQSISDQLRTYPRDLLTSAPDVRSATIRLGEPAPPTEPNNPGAAGPGAPGAAAEPGGPGAAVEPGGPGVPAEPGGPGAAAEPGGPGVAAEPGRAGTAAEPGGSAISASGPSWLTAAQTRVEQALGGRLTPLVIGLAFLLALVLGAGHAALPGHGKTVMAAYFAGRQGRIRDALAVGGTVTIAHTGGVLLLGLLLSTSTALVGEQVLSALGLTSGLLVVAVGISMLVAARRRSTGAPPHSHQPHGHHHHGPHHHHDHGPGHSHGVGLGLGHSHDLGHGHSHGLGHSHGHDLGHGHSDSHGLGLGHGHGHGHSDSHGLGLGHSHGHDHGPGSAHSHGLGHSHGPGSAHGHGSAHSHGHELEHSPDQGHSHDVGRGDRIRRRLGLAGIGLAGGLVPSPSALVVLLGAIGLGRAGLGVALVIAYGIGMAGTLTAIGLLLVVAQRRLSHLITNGRWPGRLARLTHRAAATAPTATAALVVLVGLGIGVRAMA
ncbi:hypothetical protein GCM10023107_80450 [Actinoplanes octamycinicus]|nr:hypothetical protein Aoc01nite_37750 [Actinoplanes octamycinicus]